MIEATHSHDWRMVGLHPGASQPALTVRCDDCGQLGIVSEPTALEIRRALTHETDYLSVFGGAEWRICQLPTTKQQEAKT